MKKTVQVFTRQAADNKGGALHQSVGHPEMFQLGNLDYQNPAWNQVHIYFTSHEEVKEGDYFLFGMKIKKCTGLDYNGTNDITLFETGWSAGTIQYKIVASTDKSLGLPIIPYSFVKAFADSLAPIKEVEVTGWYPVNENGVEVRYMHIPLTEPLQEEETLTIEQAADRHIAQMSTIFDKYELGIARAAFIEGAQWRESGK